MKSGQSSSGLPARLQKMSSFDPKAQDFLPTEYAGFKGIADMMNAERIHTAVAEHFLRIYELDVRPETVEAIKAYIPLRVARAFNSRSVKRSQPSSSGDIEPGSKGGKRNQRQETTIDAPAILPTTRGSDGWNEINRYVIKGVCDESSLCSLVGPSGSYKTFFLLDLAAHVALGKTWKGHRVNGGSVLYCAAEGQRALKKRIKGFELRHNVNLDNIYIYPLGVDMASPDWQQAVLNTLESMQAETGKKPQMVIIDTFTRSLMGDEKEQRDVMPFINGVQRIINESGVSAWLTQHTTKQGGDNKKGGRGSGTVYDSLDFEMQVRKEIDSHIYCEQSKAKDSGFVEPFRVKLTPIQLGVDEDNESITTLTLDGEKLEPLSEQEKVELIADRQNSGLASANNAKELRTNGIVYAAIAASGAGGILRSELVDRICGNEDGELKRSVVYKAIDRLTGADGKIRAEGEKKSLRLFCTDSRLSFDEDDSARLFDDGGLGF